MSKLDELKQQVLDTSEKQMQIQSKLNDNREIMKLNIKKKEENDAKMTDMVRSIMIQTEMVNAKDRELLNDKIDIFQYKQSLMNEQLIALNDSLKDVSTLNNVYAAKEQFLDRQYNERKNILDDRIDELESSIVKKQIELNRLDKEIETKNDELKKVNLVHSFKVKFVDKCLIYIFVGFIGLFVGGFFGWGIFSLFSSIFSAISNFLGGLF